MDVRQGKSTVLFSALIDRQNSVLSGVETGAEAAPNSSKFQIFGSWNAQSAQSKPQTMAVFKVFQAKASTCWPYMNDAHRGLTFIAVNVGCDCAFPDDSDSCQRSLAPASAIRPAPAILPRTWVAHRWRLCVREAGRPPRLRVGQAEPPADLASPARLGRAGPRGTEGGQPVLRRALPPSRAGGGGRPDARLRVPSGLRGPEEYSHLRFGCGRLMPFRRR